METNLWASRPRSLVNDRPEHPEPIPQLAEPRGEEGLLKRCVHLPALGQQLVNSLGICGRIERETEVDAADLLKHRWGHVIAGQDRVANVDPCMDDRIARVARRAGCLTLMHHHDDLAAEVLFVEAKRVLAVSAEVELCK